jgi:hypothetical protein
VRRKNALIVLVILAFGLIGTGLSAFREQSEFISVGSGLGTWQVAYGFPLGWYGYSEPHLMVVMTPNKIYWFSSESFLLDTAFWLAISSSAFIVAIQLEKMLRKTKAPKIQSGITT